MKRRFFGKRLDKKISTDSELNNMYKFLINMPLRGGPNNGIWSMWEFIANNKQERKTIKNPKGFKDEDIY